MASKILCFGEVLLRLSAPAGGRLLQYPGLEGHFGGAEANVAVALARLGHPAGLVTALPDNAVGDAAIEALRGAGVDLSGVVRAAGRLGLYFLSHGSPIMPAEIVYDRADSVFSRSTGTAWDWPRLLADAGWLHLSGITPALGPEAQRLSLDTIAAAEAAGVRVAFDGNFRASLWAGWCADPAPILRAHVGRAELMFGNHRDISLLLGRDFSGDGPGRRREAALAAFEAFPALRLIASTARRVVAHDHHRLSARIDTREDAVETGEMDLPGIVDRIGTGDAFAAGVLARLDDGIEAAARTGLALAASVHMTPGDQSPTTPRDLARIADSPGDIRR